MGAVPRQADGTESAALRPDVVAFSANPPAILLYEATVRFVTHASPRGARRVSQSPATFDSLPWMRRRCRSHHQTTRGRLCQQDVRDWRTRRHRLPAPGAVPVPVQCGHCVAQLVSCQDPERKALGLGEKHRHGRNFQNSGPQLSPKHDADDASSSWKKSAHTREITPSCPMMMYEARVHSGTRYRCWNAMHPKNDTVTGMTA